MLKIFGSKDEVKFKIRLTIKELTDLTLHEGGQVYLKWKIKGGFNKPSGSTKKQNIVKAKNKAGYMITFNQTFNFELAIPVNSQTRSLEDEICKVKVFQDDKSGRKCQELGRIYVNISEYFDADEPLQKYLLKKSNVNAFVFVSVAMDIFPGQPTFKRPHTMSDEIDETLTDEHSADPTKEIIAGSLMELIPETKTKPKPLKIALLSNDADNRPRAESAGPRVENHAKDSTKVFFAKDYYAKEPVRGLTPTPSSTRKLKRQHIRSHSQVPNAILESRIQANDVVSNLFPVSSTPKLTEGTKTGRQKRGHQRAHSLTLANAKGHSRHYSADQTDSIPSPTFNELVPERFSHSHSHSDDLKSREEFHDAVQKEAGVMSDSLSHSGPQLPNVKSEPIGLPPAFPT